MHSLTARYSLIMAFYWSNFAVLSNYASVYLLGRGMNNTEIGMMIAAASLLAALTQPLLGAFADNPRSPSVKNILIALIALFLAAAVLVSLSGTRSLFILLISYAFALTLMHCMTPLTNALATLSESAGKSVNFGISRGAGSLAYAVTSVLIGRAVAAFGISLIPLTAVGLYVFLALCLVFFPFQKVSVSSAKRSSRGFLKKYPRFILVLLSAACLYTSHVLINNFAFQIISVKGGNESSLGIAFAIAALAELPVMFAFRRLLKHFSAGKWLVISGFALFAKCIGTFLVSGVTGYYCVQLIQILGFAVITVASVYYTDSIMRPEDSVKGQAFFTMTSMIGAVLASALGGWILDLSGAGALLLCASAFSGIGAVIMLCSGTWKE